MMFLFSDVLNREYMLCCSSCLFFTQILQQAKCYHHVPQDFWGKHETFQSPPPCYILYLQPKYPSLLERLYFLFVGVSPQKISILKVFSRDNTGWLVSKRDPCCVALPVYSVSHPKEPLGLWSSRSQLNLPRFWTMRGKMKVDSITNMTS